MSFTHSVQWSSGQIQYLTEQTRLEAFPETTSHRSPFDASQGLGGKKRNWPALILSRLGASFPDLSHHQLPCPVSPLSLSTFPRPAFHLITNFLSTHLRWTHIVGQMRQPVTSAKSEILPSSVIQNFPFINEQQRRCSVQLVRTSGWVLVVPRDKNQQLNILMLLPRSFKADNTRRTKKWKCMLFYQHPRVQLG